MYCSERTINVVDKAHFHTEKMRDKKRQKINDSSFNAVFPPRNSFIQKDAERKKKIQINEFMENISRSFSDSKQTEKRMKCIIK